MLNLESHFEGNAYQGSYNALLTMKFDIEFLTRYSTIMQRLVSKK